MKKLYFLGLLAFLLLHSALSLADEDRLFVSSAQARLMADPAFNADLILELRKGDSMILSEHQGAWLFVLVDSGQEGWVSRMLTSSSPPRERVTVLSGEEGSSLRDVRRRTSAITTAAAARGLAASRRQQEDQGQHPTNYEAVDWMEALEVSDDDLQIFMGPLRGNYP